MISNGEADASAPAINIKGIETRIPNTKSSIGQPLAGRYTFSSTVDGLTVVGVLLIAIYPFLIARKIFRTGPSDDHLSNTKQTSLGVRFERSQYDITMISNWKCVGRLGTQNSDSGRKMGAKKDKKLDNIRVVPNRFRCQTRNESPT
jgi:hypothetical protein